MSIFSKYIEDKTGIKLEVEINPVNKNEIAVFNKRECIIIVDVEKDIIKYEGYNNKITDDKLKKVITDFYKYEMRYTATIEKGECLQSEFMHYIYVKNEMSEIWNGNEDNINFCIDVAVENLSNYIPWDLNHYPEMTEKFKSELRKLY